MGREWLGKPYYSLDAYCKITFGEKLYKIALDAGLTCPNRDGTLGSSGCIFCSNGGSGDFARHLLSERSFHDAWISGKRALSGKDTGQRFIAYFQAFTNTYGPVSYLEQIYRGALELEEIIGISIATRPDCLPDEVLSLLNRLKDEYPDKLIWIELGLQTIHPQTARYIRRGYPLEVFDDAVVRLKAAGIQVITHVILFLPGETEAQMLKTIDYLNCNPIDGIKLQLLHILKGTDLARDYARSPFHIPDMDEYIRCIGNCIAHLRPDIVIHRLTGDGPKDLLIEPQWTGAKRTVLNHIHQYLKKQDIWQGKEYYG